jgi:hypothetical protein
VVVSVIGSPSYALACRSAAAALAAGRPVVAGV